MLLNAVAAAVPSHPRPHMIPSAIHASRAGAAHAVRPKHSAGRPAVYLAAAPPAGAAAVAGACMQVRTPIRWLGRSWHVWSFWHMLQRIAKLVYVSSNQGFKILLGYDINRDACAHGCWKDALAFRRRFISRRWREIISKLFFYGKKLLASSV